MTTENTNQALNSALPKSISSQIVNSRNSKTLRRVKSMIVEEPISFFNKINIDKRNSNLSVLNNDISSYNSKLRGKSIVSTNFQSFLNNNSSILGNKSSLGNKNELPVIPKHHRPDFLINNKISIDERLKIRKINKNPAINNQEIYFKIKDKKIREIKTYLNKQIDKNYSKQYLVDFLLNYKQKSHTPELRNLQAHTSGAKIKNIDSGTTTILIKKDESKNKYLEKLLMMDSESSNLLKTAIKWKNLKWLFENKKDQVEIIINSYNDMSWFLKSRGTKLERSMFNEFMDLLRLNEEKDFCDNIFYLFDEDKDNYIDYKDLILGLKLSSTDTYFSKVSLIVEICSEDIFTDIDEFLKKIKSCVINRRDYKKISEIVNQFVKENNVQNLSKFNKEVLIKFLITNDKLKKIITKNIGNLPETEKMLEEEINWNCVFNLNKNKLNPYQNTTLIPGDFNKLERILDIRDNGMVEKKKNKKRNSISRAYSFESEF